MEKITIELTGRETNMILDGLLYEAYHDVMTFEDGYEERFYIGE